MFIPKLLSQRKEKDSKLIYFVILNKIKKIKNSILSEQLQNVIEIVETDKIDTTTHMHVDMTGHFPGMIHVL